MRLIKKKAERDGEKRLHVSDKEMERRDYMSVIKRWREETTYQ